MQKNWSNTSLVAYSSLQKIEKSLDFSFFRLVKSGFQSVHLKNGVSTEGVFVGPKAVEMLEKFLSLKRFFARKPLLKSPMTTIFQ